MNESPSTRQWLTGMYLLLVVTLLLWLTIGLWPDVQETEKGQTQWSTFGMVLGRPCYVPQGTRLVVLAMLLGGLGSFVHAATSFASYVGNGQFGVTWAWWYVLRPLIGGVLGLLFVLLFCSGLKIVGAQSDGVPLNLYGLAGVAGLSGMFSKQATDKLSDWFDKLLKTAAGKGDESRMGKLGAALPVSKAMIPRKQITAHSIPKDKSPADVTVKQLYERLDTSDSLTRLPVLDHEDKLKCVIHESTLCKNIAGRALAAETSATQAGSSAAEDKGKPKNKKKAKIAAKAQSAAAAPCLADLPLQALLEDDRLKKLLVESVAFVRENAKLSEAKAAMDDIPGCQDVFITKTGQRSEPILGWLTNTEIAKRCNA